MSHNSQPVIQGLKGLVTFLSKERLKIQRDKIVLISSEATNSIERPAVDDAVRQIQFLLMQRFAFRVAPVHVRSAIPDHSVKLHEVAKRFGAKTIVAVGSGNAMDVAKWANPYHIKRVIYIPATYGASLVASTSTSLKVNDQGEIDVYTAPMDDTNTKKQTTSVLTADKVHHVLLEEAHFDTETKNIALSAALAISYDAGLPIPTTLPSTHYEVYDFMTKAGRHLSYGLDPTHHRSKPLAIATALQATLFPKYTVLEIMASLLPAYDPPSHIVPAQGVPQFLTTEPWETIVQSLRENAATWNCWDAPEDELRQLLSKKHII